MCQTYILGTDVAATIADIQRGLRKVLDNVGLTREVSSRPQPALDISRARAVLGYEPKFDVEAGLGDFILGCSGSKDSISSSGFNGSPWRKPFEGSKFGGNTLDGIPNGCML